MKRRRFLHVPSSIDEWKQEGNAYSKEEDWSKDLRDRGRVKRPLPSSQILASAPLDNNASGKSTPFVPSQAPFLRDFYNAVGVNIPAKDDQPEETADDINYDNLEDIGEIDNIHNNVAIATQYACKTKLTIMISF